MFAIYALSVAICLGYLFVSPMNLTKNPFGWLGAIFYIFTPVVNTVLAISLFINGGLND